MRKKVVAAVWEVSNTNTLMGNKQKMGGEALSQELMWSVYVNGGICLDVHVSGSSVASTHVLKNSPEAFRKRY